MLIGLAVAAFTENKKAKEERKKKQEEEEKKAKETTALNADTARLAISTPCNQFAGISADSMAESFTCPIT